jgi:hypothetical protein
MTHDHVRHVMAMYLTGRGACIFIIGNLPVPAHDDRSRDQILPLPPSGLSIHVPDRRHYLRLFILDLRAARTPPGRKTGPSTAVHPPPFPR